MLARKLTAKLLARKLTVELLHAMRVNAQEISWMFRILLLR